MTDAYKRNALILQNRDAWIRRLIDTSRPCWATTSSRRWQETRKPSTSCGAGKGVLVRQKSIRSTPLTTIPSCRRTAARWLPSGT